MLTRTKKQFLQASCAYLYFMVFVFIGLPAIKAQVVRTPTPQTAIPETYFGMHIHGMTAPRPGLRSPDPWPDVPFGSWRLLAAYVDWPNLEPSKGEWQFTALDKMVAMA